MLGEAGARDGKADSCSRRSPGLAYQAPPQNVGNYPRRGGDRRRAWDRTAAARKIPGGGEEGPVSPAPHPTPGLCPRLSGRRRVQRLLGPHLLLFLCYASDTKHRYCSQGAQTSQTKPLRKPNVQNKIMYTRLAPALCPAQRAPRGPCAPRTRGWGGRRKKLAKGAVSLPHPHRGQRRVRRNRTPWAWLGSQHLSDLGEVTSGPP